MVDDSSVECFIRFVQERHQQVLANTNSLIMAVGGEDREKKVKAAQTLLVSLISLKNALAASDHPGWMFPLEQKVNWYFTNKAAQGDAGQILLNTVFSLIGEMQAQKWNGADLATPGTIDFAAIYKEYYQSSNLPQLFDQLIEQLDQIIQSGEIDSVQTIKALKKLIATIRKNARSDYFATYHTFEFAKVFVRKLTVDVLESVPGIKHLVKALRQTMDELEVQMLHVHDEVNKKLSSDIRADMPRLEYVPRALPGPVIDVEVEEVPASAG
jgi:hypothetical protein